MRIELTNDERFSMGNMSATKVTVAEPISYHSWVVVYAGEHIIGTYRLQWVPEIWTPVQREIGSEIPHVS